MDASVLINLIHVDLFRHRESPGGLVDEPEGVAVAADLLLVAVAQGRLSQDDGADARGVDLHALDPVGRDRALDHRALAQRLETLRRLAGEELLSALGLGQVGEVPRRGHGHVRRIAGEEAEGHQGRPRHGSGRNCRLPSGSCFLAMARQRFLRRAWLPAHPRTTRWYAAGSSSKTAASHSAQSS